MEVRALRLGEADEIASWRYPGRLSTYEFDHVDELERDHWAVVDSGQLVGYCCFGAPARVPGATEQSGTLDVGYGMRPERMGRGAGLDFVAAVLAFARGRFDPERFRLHVLDWNARSRRVAERLGFRTASVLRSDEGAFLVMVREVDGAA